MQSKKQIGPYEVASEIEKNATASIFKVSRPPSSDIFALKLLSNELSTDKVCIRYYTEIIQKLSGHSHPQIILPIEINEEMGQYYLLYPWVEGYTLKQFININGNLSLSISLSMIKSILSPLSFLHQKNIPHLNLKPSNIIIDRTTCKTYLTDVQFTKNISMQSILAGKLQKADLRSTYGYMAPEQFYSGMGSIGPATDIYSLGIILYEMLSGNFPFHRFNTPIELAHAHIAEPCERLLKLRKDLLPRIEQIIQKMMVKEPENRYKSTNELLHELNEMNKYSENYKHDLEKVMGSFFEIVTEDHSFTTSVETFKKSFNQQFSPEVMQTKETSTVKEDNELIAGRYRIEKLMTQTMLNQSFLGYDTLKEQKVSIQVPNKLYPSLFIRMENEFQAMKHFQHPAFIRLIDFVQEDGQCYLVREYIDGRPLKSVINSKIISIEKSIRIVISVLEGLQYLHQQQFVHKEINSDIIMVTPDLQAKITSLVVNRLEDASSINSGEFIDNAQYISPEQITQSKFDARTDVYLVGILLFELICGKPPFCSTSPVEVMDMHLRKSPRFPDRIQPFVPINLQMIIKKALEKSPEERFSTAHEFYEALNDFLISYVNVIYSYKSIHGENSINDPSTFPPEKKATLKLSKNKKKKISKMKKSSPIELPKEELENIEADAVIESFGKNDFARWLDSAFHMSEEPAPPFNCPLSLFEFEIVSSPQEMENLLLNKIQQGHTARVTAGLCWKWSNRLSKQQSLVHDIIIDEYQRPWIAHPEIQNLPKSVPNSSFWAHDPNGFSQIGNIHQAKNAKLDYVGVIVGKDLFFDAEQYAWKCNPKASKDPVLLKQKKEFLEQAKLNYHTLMTLGKKGCIVCFLDQTTEQYFKRNIIAYPPSK